MVSRFEDNVSVNWKITLFSAYVCNMGHVNQIQRIGKSFLMLVLSFQVNYGQYY